MRIISGRDTQQWEAVLDRCIFYDFYHLPAYHLMEATSSGYEAVLLVYEENDAIAAMPLIIRPLNELTGLEDSFEGYFDATSVYGYSGLVTSKKWSDGDFFERFGQALATQLKKMKIVAAFSRLHPVFQNNLGLCIGEIVTLGETVSVDLRLPLDKQSQLFRKSHRYDIRKARAESVIVFHNDSWEYYHDFIVLYHETMRRVGADKFYLFDQNYFSQLRQSLGKRIHLFVARKGKHTVSAALVTMVNGLVEYHLSGSVASSIDHTSSKLIIDEVRQWGTAQGASTFHLGGGVGAKRDNLFLFKAGFSPQRHVFNIWRYIVDDTIYSSAVEERRKWLYKHQLHFSQEEFFPLYRSMVTSDVK